MLEGRHQQAQELAAEAARLRHAGEHQRARELYEQAADLEERALSELSIEKARTRGILGVSLVSMLYKAKLYGRAERMVFALLAPANLTQDADRQLRDLLEAVWDEKVVDETLGQRYVDAGFVLSLKGDAIGFGTAPLDVALHHAEGLRSLLYRAAEWSGLFPFRRRGLPPREVLDVIQLRAAPATPGSYRIPIHLVEPAQMDLYTDPRVSAAGVSDAVFKLFRVISAGRPEEIEEHVRDEQYRTAMLKLVRNIAPTGRRVREVEVIRLEGQRPESVLLWRDSKQRISDYLRPRTSVGDERVEIRGVLRAVHLDDRWLRIVLEDGTSQKCKTPGDMLDDVVGPMVNRRVVVKGTSSRAGAVVTDIELDEDDD